VDRPTGACSRWRGGSRIREWHPPAGRDGGGAGRGRAHEARPAFWINVPDPWPKKRHHRRRLLQPAFVAALARRLVPGGELHAATDHAEYAEQMHAVLSAEPRLENALAAPFVAEMPGRLCTAYEAMWRAEGRPLHFFSYRRRSAP
jgi:tRNA G46 methylase TrmB